jgi:beta-glucosidase
VAKPLIKVAANLVTLSSPTPGAKLFYTTTGRTPSFTAADEYKQPFALPRGATVKALAKVSGVDNSSLASYVDRSAK